MSGPVTTAFWHLGEFGNGEEWQVVLKTTRARYAELEAHLIAEHPWDNPEVTFTTLGGSAAYLEWVSRATAQVRGFHEVTTGGNVMSLNQPFGDQPAASAVVLEPPLRAVISL